MKFIHTSDICYGITPDKGRPWSRERAEAVRASLSAIVLACAGNGADLLLISGNLFGGQPAPAWCEEADALFRSVPETEIYIAAGDRDYLTAGSPVRSFDWAPNVHWFTEETPEERQVPGSSATVTGISCCGRSSRKMSLEAIAAAESEGPHILLTYTGTGSIPDPETAGWSYCALGHSHQPQPLDGGIAASPGSPEPLGPEDTGAHGYYLGELSTDGRLLRHEFVPLASVRYVPLTVHITPAVSAEELLRSLSAEMDARGRENIYSIRFTGVRAPAVEIDPDSLRMRYRILSAEDETEPGYDMKELFAEHPSDMIGLFIRKMNVPDASPIDRKALFYGVDALLRTSPER